jgi:hypothetical protein
VLIEKQRHLAMPVEQAGESIVITDAEGLIIYGSASGKCARLPETGRG